MLGMRREVRDGDEHSEANNLWAVVELIVRM